MAPQVTPEVFSSHYKRLQEIEQHVVQAVAVAADALDGLGADAQPDQEALRAQCEALLKHVRAAQALVADAVAGAFAERSFEATAYQPMAQAAVASERVAAVALHVEGMQRLLQQHAQLHLMEVGAVEGQEEEAEAELLLMDFQSGGGAEVVEVAGGGEAAAGDAAAPMEG